MPHRSRTTASIVRVPELEYDVLDVLIGYALRRAQVALYGAFDRATRGMDITPPRFTALVIVGANAGISQSTLGTVLGIARSGAMMLVDWMVERGMVERRNCPRDRRAWGLHLTVRGERFVEKMKASVLAEDRRQASLLSSAERRTLLGLLDKISVTKKERRA
ncbi:MAG: MarR family winged helix-turn-helix transcriptional regulator [Betaproteobacteria bacterium]|nr:MarR family winged helix-turn-helix transcriptional regulator [Betaproteobacteria bacterium]